MLDFSINVATKNGSGSQSANNILSKSLFRLGLPIGAKNLFPSNIAGLPTWFQIRVNEKGYVSRKSSHDIVVAMNDQTIAQDIKTLKSDGVFIYNSDIKFDPVLLPNCKLTIGIPCRQLIKNVTDSIKLKKLLNNMIYVGVVGKCLGIPKETLEQVMQDTFKDKPHVLDSNAKAIFTGYEFAETNVNCDEFPIKVKSIPNNNQNKILIDGNAAAGIGFAFGGCTFMSWYPITPSSSLAETFISVSEKYRKEKDGTNNFAHVQAEDELSAISMVMGAGWAGARSMTTTSGPGISLMAEAVGLGYFAEIPAVIWDVQRVGPSTGLPTRTMQGDVLSAATLSHGDTEHVVLFPACPQECFEFAQSSLDIAEKLQTPVFVLSDLDIGMNNWIVNKFDHPSKEFERGKVLDANKLEKLQSFSRYKDIDGDGITYRTLPGTDHPLAAYFTRGTGHDENANYSEDNKTYKDNLKRLARKYETAKSFVPKPIQFKNPNAKVGLMAYGSTDAAIDEARALLKNKNIETSYLRLRALPFTDDIIDFIDSHDSVILIEQNRDAQMKGLLLRKHPQIYNKLKSILQFDGLPIEAEYIVSEILESGL